LQLVQPPEQLLAQMLVEFNPLPLELAPQPVELIQLQLVQAQVPLVVELLLEQAQPQLLIKLF
jgi:hypothetical protein